MAVLTATPTATPTSERDNWRTPADLFLRLSATYGPFDVDAAAEEHNALAAIWLGPGSAYHEDALAIHWAGLGATLPRVWLNPPYSRCKAFVAKAAVEAKAGRARTTLLLPATTDVQWFHDWVWSAQCRRFRPGVEVEFLKRVKFLRPDGSAAGGPTFGSVVVTFWA